MKTFIFKLRHDRGYIRIKIVALSVESAKDMLMAAEQCPERAIVKITQVTGRQS